MIRKLRVRGRDATLPAVTRRHWCIFGTLTVLAGAAAGAVTGWWLGGSRAPSQPEGLLLERLPDRPILILGRCDVLALIAGYQALELTGKPTPDAEGALDRILDEIGAQK